MSTYYLPISILDVGHLRTKFVPWCFGVQTFLDLPCPLPGEFLTRNPGGLPPLPCSTLVCSLSPLFSLFPSFFQAKAWGGGSYRIICPQGRPLPHLSGEMDLMATEVIWFLREPVSVSGNTLGWHSWGSRWLLECSAQRTAMLINSP